MDGLLPLLITSLIIGSCFSAPVTTPSLTPTLVDQGGVTDLNFLDIEDVMMDPTAKMRKLAHRRMYCIHSCAALSRQSPAYTGIYFIYTSAAWQKQVGDITYLTDKFLLPEDPDDPFFELPVTAEQRSKRAAVKNRYRLWPNGVVPYVISTAYTGIQ